MNHILIFISEYTNNPSFASVSHAFHNAHEQKKRACHTILQRFVQTSGVTSVPTYKLLMKFDPIRFQHSDFFNINFFSKLQRGQNALVFYKKSLFRVAIIGLIPNSSSPTHVKVYFYKYSCTSPFFTQSCINRTRIFSVHEILQIHYYTQLNQFSVHFPYANIFS